MVLRRTMVNRCKLLNIALNTCGLTNAGCPFMADPHSCPDYDEYSDRSYMMKGYTGKSPTEIAKAEAKRVDTEIESLTEFAGRLESELDGLGIKVERTEEITGEVPDWF